MSPLEERERGLRRPVPKNVAWGTLAVMFGLFVALGAMPLGVFQ